MVTRVAAAALSLSCLLLGAGCDADSDPPPTTPPPVTSTALPPSTAPASTTSAPTTPADGAPVLPDAARAQTPEGAEAFVQHWFNTVNFSYMTMSTRSLRELSTANCRTCAALADTVDEVASRGNVLSGGDANVVSVDGTQSGDAGTVMATFNADPLTETTASGEAVELVDPGGQGVRYSVELVWRSGKWLVDAALLDLS